MRSLPVEDRRVGASVSVTAVSLVTDSLIVGSPT